MADAQSSQDSRYWSVVKCNCGDAACNRYGLNVGMFPQGAGFDGIEDAQLAAAAPALLGALESLLPGLILDLRYANEEDDKEAMRSRIETVTEAIAQTMESQQDQTLGETK